ncbi:MAG: FtsX-like permease family protein [Phycisphaerae bacterium]|jgi:lipoprotein-releasing system permease protein
MYDIILPIRFFLRRRITILAVLAVAICVFTVVVVMTVMTGLVKDYTQKNHDFYGDCIVWTDSLVGFGMYEEFIDELQKTDFVASASPVINSFGLVQMNFGDGSAALTLMGIDIKRHIKTTNFAQTLYYRAAAPELAFVPEDENLSGCVTGIDLTTDRTERGTYIQKAYVPSYSYTITCFPLTPKGAIVKTGTAMAANSKIFHYSDNSNSGLAKVDSSVVYLPFEQLQKLCGMDTTAKRAGAIFIKFTKDSNITICSAKVAAMWRQFTADNSNFALADLFKNVSVADWKTYRRDTIAPMEKEQIMLILLFLLVGLITVFIIFVIFYMIISRKSKDIGILKSLGISQIGVVRFFLHLAFMVGLCGSAFGIVFALAFLVNANRLEGWLFAQFGFQLWNREIYAIGEIPHNAGVFLLIIVAVSAVVACLLGALVPTLGAAKMKCVDVLRVNKL